MNKTYLKMAVAVMRLVGQNPREFGRNKDIDLVSLTEVEFPTHVRVNYRSAKAIREAAAACHASQGGAKMNKGLQGLVNWLFGGHTDTFMQAYPVPEEGQKVKRDLFE